MTHIALGKRNWYVGVEHLNFFDARSLRRLLETAGIEVLSAEWRGFNPTQFYLDLKGVDVSVGEMVDLCEKVGRIRTSSVLVPLRKFHRAVERVIGRLGPGDILNMGGMKSSSGGYERTGKAGRC